MNYVPVVSLEWNKKDKSWESNVNTNSQDSVIIFLNPNFLWTCYQLYCRGKTVLLRVALQTRHSNLYHGLIFIVNNGDILLIKELLVSSKYGKITYSCLKMKCGRFQRRLRAMILTGIEYFRRRWKWPFVRKVEKLRRKLGDTLLYYFFGIIFFRTTICVQLKNVCSLLYFTFFFCLKINSISETTRNLADRDVGRFG